MLLNGRKRQVDERGAAVYMRTIIINDVRPRATLSLLGILLFAPPVTVAGETHRYTVTVDERLTRLTVEARFDRATTDLSARSRLAPRYLLAARDCESGQTLGTRGQRMVVPSGGTRCLSYAINLEHAAADDRRNDMLHPSNRIASPAS